MKKLIIMGGLPGSGKSTVAKRNNNFGTSIKVDCDELKKECDGYDPNHPELVHEASKKLEVEVLNKLLEGNESFLYDTTATNTKRIAALIKKAKANGFEVTFVYVKVTLETSLARNAQRERHVPEEIIYEKFGEITNAVRCYKTIVDNFLEVKND